MEGLLDKRNKGLPGLRLALRDKLEPTPVESQLYGIRPGNVYDK